MIKNSSEYLDVKELVDFVLEYGKDNSLPNMEGSGEAAYQAALRLQQHGQPKAVDRVFKHHHTEKEMVLAYLRDMADRGDETAKNLLRFLEENEDD